MTNYNTATHTLAAYQQAAQSFMNEHGFTPYDAVSSPAGLPAEVLAQARFLDGWDIWLFQ